MRNIIGPLWDGIIIGFLLSQICVLVMQWWNEFDEEPPI